MAENNGSLSGTAERVFTVDELTGAIRSSIERQFGFIAVLGEVSNLRQPSSGHIYFVLKDERSQLKAVLFKGQQRYLRDLPVDGQMILCRGRLSVYELRGEYQLIVDHLESYGTGNLQKEFERLKQQLEAEGLFARERKKELPLLPGRVVLVTSATGAAVHDFIRVAQARCPAVALAVYPVAVQGEAAAGEIATALKDINERYPADVIVLCRGGGSIEDLWAFNEEELARAIYASIIPVVSAVGHEVDYTIADFTADKRAATPSAAAELIVPDQRYLAERLSAVQGSLKNRLNEIVFRRQAGVDGRRQILGKLKPELDQLTFKLDQRSGELEQVMRLALVQRNNRLSRLTAFIQANNPKAELKQQQQHLHSVVLQLQNSGRVILKQRRDRLSAAAALLQAVSPLSTLARGYAVVRKTDARQTVVHSSRQVVEGEELLLLVHEGSLQCRVLSTSPKHGLGDKVDV